MNGPIWVAWAIDFLCAVISVTLLLGKGSFLIAGYNTAKQEKKAAFNIKRLNRVVGIGFTLITVILVIFTIYKFDLPSNIQWIMPWGLLAIISVVGILANTVCKKKYH